MLEYNDERHEYRLDGVIIPSVTQVLSAAGLIDFDYVSREALEIATERGNIVHRIIELYELGTLDESSIDPALRGYFDGYLSVKAAGLLPARPDAIEEMVHSPLHRYAGRLDQRFGADWINDIKTGSQYKAHGLQLSGYWFAIQPDMRISPRRLTCTYLTADGGGTVKDYQYDPLNWIIERGAYNVMEKYK